jgi:hypothetical protein
VIIDCGIKWQGQNTPYVGQRTEQVVIKVASSMVKQPDKYWPPALPDAVETIAAS